MSTSSDSPGPRRGAGLLALAAAGLAYAAWLGGQHIPHIGDEAVYLAIARKTAEAGRWLPLATVEGLGQTKPPLLFFSALATYRLTGVWDLALLRLPVLLSTFLTAGVVGWVGRRLGGRGTGLLAALSFLAFASTFQYGRPFLTNLPETLFVFLPFAVALVRPSRLDAWSFWVFAGLSTGLACLVKSFALVLPVAVAFSAWLLLRRRGDLGAFLRRDLPKGALAALLALGVFGLWPLLDPDPGAIWREFVLGENVGKVRDGGWLRGLVSPTHGIWTTLLGPFFNAGFLAPATVWLAWDALRRGRRRSEAENALWLLLLAFVVVFTLPGHRQANYLLPAMPALAVLLGLAWPRIPKLWLGATAFAVAVGALGGIGFQLLVRRDVLPPGAYGAVELVLPVATLLLAAFVAARPRHARRLVHLLVFLAYLVLGAVLAPFEGPLGRYAPETVDAVRGEAVWVPSRFRAREERHRFLLPGADVRGYPEKAPHVATKLLERGEQVVVRVAPGAAAPDGVLVVGERLDLRTRQTPAELRALLLELKVDVLVQREILGRRDEGGGEVR